MNKNIIAAISGIVLEAYNSTLYGCFAIILAPLFFSSDLGISPITGSFIAFAAGYLGRPFGGILFGYLGDRLGRRTALSISALLTTIPTLIIGLLPTYPSVGIIIAPILLILCRLLQGIAIGGDYTGALAYVAEQRGIKNKVFITCLAASIGFFGASLGIVVSLFSSTSLVFSGNWRYSFLSAGFIGLYVTYIRWYMDESPSYVQVKEKNEIEQNPLLTSLQKDKKNLLACGILGGTNFAVIYLATVYMNLHLKELLFLSNEIILINNLLVFLTIGILILLSSSIISKFEELKLINFCKWWFSILTLPFYIGAYHIFSLYSLLFLQVFLIIGNAFQVASLAFIMPKLFPTNHRYSGMAFSYSLGTALIGGMAPLISSWLVNKTHLLWAPGIFLTVIILFYWFAVEIAKSAISSKADEKNSGNYLT